MQSGKIKKLARHSCEFRESRMPRHCNKALAARDGTNTCHCDNQRLASLLAYNQPLGNRFVVA
jgi:hypothetical protein